MEAHTARVLRFRKEGPATTTVDLVGDQRLVVEKGAMEDVLSLVGADGDVSLTIRVTAQGPVAELEGSQVGLRVKGCLSIEAERLALTGTEEVVISSGGDLNLDAAGDLSSEGEAHRIRGRRGNVDIRANDDVTLDGERIKMNC